MGMAKSSRVLAMLVNKGYYYFQVKLPTGVVGFAATRWRTNPATSTISIISFSRCFYLPSSFGMDFEMDDGLFDTPDLGDDLAADDGQTNDGGIEEPGNVSVAAKKFSVRRPRLKLDAARLCGERGLPALTRTFQDVSFKGKGHEVNPRLRFINMTSLIYTHLSTQKEDLDKLMRTMQHWAFRLYPKMNFDEFLEKVEKLGKKREVQTCVKKIRLDMLVADELVLPDNEVPNQEESEPEFVDPFDELVAQNHFPEENHRPVSPVIQNTTQELTEDQVKRMERNRLMAQQRRKSRNFINEGASTSTADIDTDF
uniref:TIMELESS-interacting protein n=1 Tax=Strigamia maritima TaxID=126957 RepID=T1IWQ6_STRMM